VPSLLDPSSWLFWRRTGSSGIKREAGVQLEGPKSTFSAPQYAVTADTAMQISAVWAAVQLKSTILSSLDLNFYRMTDSGREAVTDHHLAQLFRGPVNRYQNRVEFFETLGLNLYLTGNAYCLIQRSGNKIVSLMPLMSAQMELELLRDGTLVYTYLDSAQNVRVFAPENIWHVKLMGNGVQGLSPLDYSRNSISVAMAGEDWATRLVGNGGKPTGVLMIDRVLNEEQRKQIRNQFKELREGSNDTIMVLEANMKYEQVSLSPQDVQLLEARRFQIEDIARFFNVPSVLINDTAGSTVWGSGIQQIITGWYKLGFRPELERIEQSITNSLMTPVERTNLSCEFDFEELLRTDFETRVQTGARAVGAGLMTRNEWRKREWLPEVEGADELTAQVNLTTLEELPRATGGRITDVAED
jgi:HK97 family phage portal protein